MYDRKKKPSKCRIPWIKVVRENVSTYEAEARTVATSEAAFRLLRDRLGAEMAEVMVVLMLDGRNRCVGMVEVARGGLHGCAVSVRDILRPAIACGASGFVLAHSHPSGDPTPSPEDLAMTRKIIEAADVIGTPCLDHIVVTATRHYSMLSNNVGGF